MACLPYDRADFLAGYLVAGFTQACTRPAAARLQTECGSLGSFAHNVLQAAIDLCHRRPADRTPFEYKEK